MTEKHLDHNRAFLFENAAWIEKRSKIFIEMGILLKFIIYIRTDLRTTSLVNFQKRQKDWQSYHTDEFSSKKVMEGDYSADFTPVNQWRGIDKFQHK